MAATITLKSNVKSIQKRLNDVFRKFPNITKKGLGQAGFQLIDIIRTLTQKGVDYKRRRFAPYSSSYLEQLQKEGKPTAVDLFYSGDMLGSLTTKVHSSRKASVFFNRNTEAKKALFNQVLREPKREFFGFDKRTEKIIQQSFIKFVEKEIRKFNV
jgi:hypothetical protein